MASSKIIKTVTPRTPQHPKTRWEVMDNFKNEINDQIDMIRRMIDKEMSSYTDRIEMIRNAEFSPNLMSGMWTGMGDMQDLAGGLSVWLKIACYHKYTIEQRNGEWSGFEQLLDILEREVLGDAISDKYRSESSSNQFSNAIANSQGLGRGRGYEDVLSLIRRTRRSLAKAV